MDEPKASRCPCGKGATLGECCGRFLSRAELPARAEELMRSRYCAYVLADIDYVMETHDPSTSMNADRASAARWAKESQFTGLEIVATEGGEADDDSGVVEFKARYVRDGASCVHHERSTFRKTRGRWYYVDGEQGKPTHGARTGPKIGRNDPCPCGSGKKYKKCCG